jgi:hypothetical protein
LTIAHRCRHAPAASSTALPLKARPVWLASVCLTTCAFRPLLQATARRYHVLALPPQSWESARKSCQCQGEGWDLPVFESYAEQVR